MTTPAQSVAYLAQLNKLAPDTHFLPSLYLSLTLTPALIREAHAVGVVGVKSYPRGVTTNSDGGVGMEGYGVFDAVFGEMEKVDMILNLHGEVPSDVDGNVSSFSRRRGNVNRWLIGVAGCLRPRCRSALPPAPARDPRQVPQAQDRPRALHDCGCRRMCTRLRPPVAAT